VHDWLARARAWIAILILAPFAVAALLAAPYAPAGSSVDFLIDAMAWLIFIAGGTFRWWATLYIGSRKQCVLVTHGPYSLCRNPLYVGTFLIVLSIAFFLQSATFAAGLVLASVIYLTTTVSIEEKNLRHHFGPSYDSYCREVPRFVPRFAGFRSPANVEVSIAGLGAEYRRMARWIWVPLLAEAVAHMKTDAWWSQLHQTWHIFW